METRIDQIETHFNRIVEEVNVEHEQCPYLLRVYNDLVVLLSEASSLHFNTLFARVSFISSRFPISKAWSYALQIPRRELYKRELADEDLYPILKATVFFLLDLCRQESNPPQKSKYHPVLPTLPERKRQGEFKKKFARVIAVEWNRNEKLLTILDEDEPEGSWILQYSVSGVNDIFSETLELTLTEIGMPLVLGLTDVACTEDGHYIPGYIVIIPDMLLDVTAVTQVLSRGADPLACNIMDVFLPTTASDAIMKGNVANYILDELIRDTQKSFTDIFASSFKLFPIEFVRMTDIQLKGMHHRMHAHYTNILKVIEERFPVLGIDRKYCVIEPSYFSPQYGIKGRLDLYYEHEADQSASIIELKSSKPFMPNSYGLSSANYHQTLLYDLLIKSTHGASFKRSNFILYSAEPTETLRYAVSVEAIQKETIQHRNQLVLLQYRLMCMDDPASPDLFKEINPQAYIDLKGYLKRNIELWDKVYGTLSPGEKAYFKSFTAFVTREHTLARIGSDKGDGSGGLAGLWLDNMETKEERYHVLQGLELKEISIDVHETLITFDKGSRTNPLANFRSGDIAVMYPCESAAHVDPTRYQLHRASILQVDAQEVVIRLRNMQIHTGQIEKYKYWNLERDMLDSSFRGLYQSLWLLMGTDAVVRQRILGLVASPALCIPDDIMLPDGLTANQSRIYEEGIKAGGTYLLWGPPGTGKTSMMLKSWVWYFFTQTTSRIVLLAYTNKAVDEICEALELSNAEIKEDYIRIGSRTATGEAYRYKLLDQIIEPMKTRAKIKQRLMSTRIVVATIASLQSKNELMDMMTFDVAIMDEASQLLEPAIVGLLTRFQKSILIGDHMQLPAVSVQSELSSRIQPEAEWGKRIGLTDMRMSYFERLYRLYQHKGWHHLIGIVFEQGRMHQDIMAFANQYVYSDKLQIVDSDRQTKIFPDVFVQSSEAIFNHRLIFIPTTSTLEETTLKTNQDEAIVTIDLIASWQEKIRSENLRWTIGVITPFRAQIAAIIHLAHQKNLDLSGVTVDTVERYQGGACDIIIMSCAVNTPRSLDKITSLNDDGIDRKLNVAVSRARQQFVLVGNEELLKKEEGYGKLIEMSFRITGRKG